MQPSGPNRPIELHHSPPPQSPQQGTPRAAPKRTRSHTHTSHPNIHRPPSAACPHTTGPPGTDPPITQQHQVGIYKSKVPIRWPGGPSEAATPDPIPNSAVKRLSAHGTASQDAGESVAARPPDGNLPHPPTRSPPTSPSPSAGWSSPVARQAHNLKVTGSNPVPASKHHPPPTHKHATYPRTRTQQRGQKKYAVFQLCLHDPEETLQDHEQSSHSKRGVTTLLDLVH